MTKVNNIIDDIKGGKIDINNQSSFFKKLIKGLLLDLNNEIKIRGVAVPHFILHTGDDIMFLENKGQDQSVEPLEVSNEDYIYNIIPRCIVNPGNVDLLPDQLTNPYTFGRLEFEHKSGIYNLIGEFRRMPLKLSCDIKYYVDSYSDMMTLIQQIVTKTAFIRTYSIVYLGQIIQCSYKIPESFSDEHTMDIDGTMTDSKSKTLSLSLEIESCLPIYSNRTIMSADTIITKARSSSQIKNKKEDFCKYTPEIKKLKIHEIS